MITIIDIDDWVGVYKDGELRYEGHSISNEELLRIADIDYEVKYIDHPNEELFWGGMPGTLEDVEDLLANPIS